MFELEKDTVAAVNEIILSDYQRLTQRFTGEIMAQWDADGEGSFAIYFKVSLAEMWVEYVREN